MHRTRYRQYYVLPIEAFSMNNFFYIMEHQNWSIGFRNPHAPIFITPNEYIHSSYLFKLEGALDHTLPAVESHFRTRLDRRKQANCKNFKFCTSQTSRSYRRYVEESKPQSRQKAGTESLSRNKYTAFLPCINDHTISRSLKLIREKKQNNHAVIYFIKHALY